MANIFYQKNEMDKANSLFEEVDDVNCFVLYLSRCSFFSVVYYFGHFYY